MEQKREQRFLMKDPKTPDEKILVLTKTPITYDRMEILD